MKRRLVPGSDSSQANPLSVHVQHAPLLSAMQAAGNLSSTPRADMYEMRQDGCGSQEIRCGVADFCGGFAAAAYRAVPDKLVFYQQVGAAAELPPRSLQATVRLICTPHCPCPYSVSCSRAFFCPLSFRVSYILNMSREGKKITYACEMCRKRKARIFMVSMFCLSIDRYARRAAAVLLLALLVKGMPLVASLTETANDEARGVHGRRI